MRRQLYKHDATVIDNRGNQRFLSTNVCKITHQPLLEKESRVFVETPDGYNLKKCHLSSLEKLHGLFA